MKIAVLPNMTRVNAPQVTLGVCISLSRLGVSFVLSDKYAQMLPSLGAVHFVPEQELVPSCDAVIAVGGDGSLIHAAKKAALCSKPVLGVNAGRLAYMAGLESTELELLKELISGNYSIDKRMMLKATLCVGGDELFSSYCINDAVIARGSRLELIDTSLSCNGTHFMTYNSDGIIIATPTGSTAYSFSAGGPVIEPTVESILVTPVCNHALLSRPVIFGADSVLGVRVKEGCEAVLSCDGGDGTLIPPDALINIEKAPIYADFIRIKNDTFMDTLGKKLSNRGI
ncbi:MAG: NAD(+)/NADH kinase [Clostridiales bacterium]|nr:NAD(+)/NADH kinase [Clostridiales bacterium]